MPRFAALDVGSNALRLRIIEAHAPSRATSERTQLPLLRDARENPDTGWTEVLSLRAPVRLGSEVFVTGKLAPSSIAQACSALKQFREAMNAERVVAYRATATSAVREAANGSTLVERARREAGIELEVIEGVEEARLVQLAVVRRLALEDRRALLMDVGGGSTELTLLERGAPTYATSLALGTVRLLETFLRHGSNVDEACGRSMEARILRTLEPSVRELGASADLLVATGGNVETLADLCPAPSTSPSRGICVEALGKLMVRLCSMTTGERRDQFGLRPDRAETIVPSSAIFLMASRLFQAKTILVPGAGLKEGILEELVDRHFSAWDESAENERVLSACTRLGRKYQFDEAHAKKVCRLAGDLFDDLHAVHKFGQKERLLLCAGAMLHDIGEFVRRDGHDEHGHYIIVHSDIMGLSPEERAIVGNLARYHRRGVPDASHAAFRELDRDARAKVRALAGLLRVADALADEEGEIEAVRAELDGPGHHVKLHVAASPSVEERVQAKADLLREVFDVRISVLAPPTRSTEVAVPLAETAATTGSRKVSRAG